MTERPILFSGPMVRAILDGKKTQTRRVVKTQMHHSRVERFDREWTVDRHSWLAIDESGGQFLRLPYAEGDTLWVREAHMLCPATAYRMSEGIEQRVNPSDLDTAAVFREGFDRSGKQKWRPSIYMPRWASRITLTVTDVRVQRLQEISGQDAWAEGVPTQSPDVNPLHEFEELWDSLNAKRGYGWDENPWVAAYTFILEDSPC